MTKTTNSYRHKLVHDDSADLVAYQCNSGDCVWQTVSVWMIPQQAFLEINNKERYQKKNPSPNCSISSLQQA